MVRVKNGIFLLMLTLLLQSVQGQQRRETDFTANWQFLLGEDSAAIQPSYKDAGWQKVQLPHDWSINAAFSEKYPTTYQQGALPAGIGWYRKSFTLEETAKNQRVYINFDGIYKNSDVWVNGHHLGKRPNGYISFRYELTPHLSFGNTPNVITVRVDNAAQPDSRWYTGSGIYRKVSLLFTNAIAVDHWGTFVTTPVISEDKALVIIKTAIRKQSSLTTKINVQTAILDAAGRVVADQLTVGATLDGLTDTLTDKIFIENPILWSVDRPYRYMVRTTLLSGNTVIDEYLTPMGIRYFTFDVDKGFFLNGQPLKILGVCNHHDLGALGAAVNPRAIERQLQILKRMGCNAIRTAHNPPAPELLELCDKMGFLVMDEAFDMWNKRKNKQDYHLDFDKWHRADLEDQVRRDRNHPSIILWSIGNEIREQFDSTGITITRNLVNIVKSLDTTRPVTCALTENFPEKNFIYQSGALDLLGFNYKLEAYKDLPARFPGVPLLAAETMSALATRGWYDMPSDSTRLWPKDGKTPYVTGIPGNMVSAYDHVNAYWGSTHEAGWNAVKKLDFMAGLFVWSGFDFLGEPVPFQWPSRSSYYGIIDLAGFPKDVYYMYQSEWTTQPVLHLFPHWNWQPGKVVDVWAYYNNADEVELYLDGRSLGKRKKEGDQLHVMWRVNYKAGTLKAISRKNGQVVLTRVIATSGKPASLRLVADRSVINSTTNDLSFVKVEVLDARGNLVPNADNLVQFKISGNGFIAGVDNGSQTSHEPFKADYRKAFHGLCLAIVQSNNKAGKIVLTASSPGLPTAQISIVAK